MIHADANDAITTLVDVGPDGDFDSDGVANGVNRLGGSGGVWRGFCE